MQLQKEYGMKHERVQQEIEAGKEENELSPGTAGAVAEGGKAN